jgi:Zn finger protein HypA/HybF involved in hydrogenase expression
VDDLRCPRCGEEDELVGEQRNDTIIVTCEACATEWERDLTPRCPTCGSDDVRIAFQAIVEKSRGTQLSMSSVRRLYLCPTCDAEQLAVYQVSNRPLPPDELPTETDD